MAGRQQLGSPRLLSFSSRRCSPTCSLQEILWFGVGVLSSCLLPHLLCTCASLGPCRVAAHVWGDSWPVCPSAGAAHRQPVGADVLPALSPGAQGLGRAIPQWAGFPRREAATGHRANARAEPPGRNATVDLPELPEERGGRRAAGGAGAGPGSKWLRSWGWKGRGCISQHPVVLAGCAGHSSLRAERLRHPSLAALPAAAAGSSGRRRSGAERSAVEAAPAACLGLELPLLLCQPRSAVRCPGAAACARASACCSAQSSSLLLGVS